MILILTTEAVLPTSGALPAVTSIAAMVSTRAAHRSRAGAAWHRRRSVRSPCGVCDTVCCPSSSRPFPLPRTNVDVQTDPQQHNGRRDDHCSLDDGAEPTCRRDSCP